MARSCVLHLEHLESRDVPALFGIPWMDGQRLTLSFVPDGTAADGVVSTLDKTLNRTIADDNAYRNEILRAFQQWIAPANLNISVVTDSGDAIGITGATQHDTRFGDIRVGAHWLSYDALAITAPPGPLSGTRTGDILLNDKYTFTIGPAKYDLYTVMMQEGGHALGLMGSLDTTSILYPKYQGVKTTIAATDVAAVQALYGVRQHDVFEGDGNNSIGEAEELELPDNAASTSTLVAQADLTTATDVDFYRYKTTSSRPLTINLNASKYSLLAAKLSIYDSNKNLLKTATASGPGGNLTLTLSSVTSDATYYLEVEQAPGTAFSVGAYELEIINTSGAARVNAEDSIKARNDNYSNETRGTASSLSTTAGYSVNTHYETYARFRSTTDVDYYKFRSATVAAGTPNVMTLSSWATNGATAPTMTVYDKNGVVVPFQTVDSGRGMTTICFGSAVSNQDYYVALARPAGASDLYRMTIDFRTVEANLNLEQQGTLSQSKVETWSNLWVGTTDLRYFTLNATSLAGQTNAAVQMTIYGIRGEVVGTLTARAGETVNTSILLNSGLYWVRISAGTSDSSALGSIAYILSSRSLTDPISVLILDSTTTGGVATTPPPEPSLTWSPGSHYGWLTNLYPESNPYLL